MIKIGLIGCGSVATYGHLPAILETPGLVLHALCDPDPVNLERARSAFGPTVAYGDLEAFFRSGIDAVSITSPAPCHLGNVLDAARHRLPVLCEKPLAMSREEGEAMGEAMRRTGVPLYTAFCYRFSPVALKIRELVAEKAIGEVRSLRLIYNWDLHGKYVVAPDGTRMIQRRREERMLEGGPMVDCGTHQIDLAHFWLNSEVTHFACHGAWVEDFDAPDHLWLHLDHASGAHTVVEMSFSYHQTSRHPRMEFVYELIGTEGVIRYDREASLFTFDDASGRTVLPFAEEKNFAGMYAEWEAALRRGDSKLLTGVVESLRVTELATGATREAMARRKSIHQGTPARSTIGPA